PTNSSCSVIAESISYTIPKLYDGKEWYIGFYAFDPRLGKLKRKKIKINFMKSKTDRRKLARDIIVRLTEKLIDGWNPWIEAIQGSSYILFYDCCDQYKIRIEKLTADGFLNKDSRQTTLSHLNVILKYNSKLPLPIKYAYQFDKKFISNFLDWMYIDKGVSPRTRDNYLTWIRQFSAWMVEKDYLKNRPDESFKVLGSRMINKRRNVIDDNDLKKLVLWLESNNKSYLLAVYLLFYCLIRPKEMALLKLHHISIKDQTIFIPSEISKNKKDAVVTIPEVVLKLMIELEIFNYPDDYYLFSKNFKPGEKFHKSDMFRDYWLAIIRPTFKFPKSYQFYSLKDTGITNMLKNNMDPLSVRDQARHSSITMTNKYTPQSGLKAPEKLKRYRDVNLKSGSNDITN
ncbi:MAG: tyrosine-type recombinase/integrase, partial [Bacteroidales bacterium]